MDCDHIHDRSAFTHKPFILGLRNVLFLRTKHNLYLIKLQNRTSKVKYDSKESAWTSGLFPGFNLRFDGLTNHTEQDRCCCVGIKLLLNDGSRSIVGDSSSESDVGKWIEPEMKGMTIAHYINWWLKGRSRKLVLCIYVVGIARNR